MALDEMIEGLLPAWGRAQFRNRRAWKTVFRCWVATWASFILLFPDASARTLGNAGFFGFLVAFVVPPSMPIQMFAFLMLMVGVGMGMGWGIGAAAMRASVAARNQNLLSAALFRANQTAAGSENPDAVFSSEVFRGDFLDWRSSIVYGGFIAFSAILFSTVRAYAPKFTLLSIFGMLITDVFCTIGPLIPITHYTIISSFFISAGCYAAIALICIVVIFPETMSHVYLSMTCGLLGMMKKYVEAQDAILAAPPDQTCGEVAKKKGAVLKNYGLKGQMSEALQGLVLKKRLVEAEFSWGRWSGSDCKKLTEPLKLLVSRLSGLQAFPRLVANYAAPMPPEQSALWNSMLSSQSQVFNEQAAVPQGPSVSQADTLNDIGIISQFTSPRHARELTLAATLPRLRMISSPLSKACASTLGACIQAITDVNERRWPWSQMSATADLERALDIAIDSLRQERAHFITDGRLSLSEPFVAAIPSLSLSSTAKDLPMTPALLPYIIASSFSAQLVIATDAILVLADLVRATCGKRTKSRLWAPSGLRSAWNSLFGRNKNDDDDGLEQADGEDQRPDLEEAEADKVETPYKRDPDSRPPSNSVQKFMDFLYNIYKWTKSKEALYIWKYTIVTVCLWLPSVFRSTAHLYYVERAVWGLIAAQTIMNVYTSDVLYNLIARFVGTAIGMLLAIVIWYIGNGNGTGNRFGLAASLGLVLVPLVFLRVFAPPHSSMPYLMCNLTIALIIGYSWLDAAVFTEDNPGIGWPVAWRRAVVLFIGAGAAFIIMMIPPTSGRKAVRLHNASIINELGKLYSLLMSSWINEEGTRFTRVKGKLASTSTVFLNLTNTQTFDEEKGSKLPTRYPPVQSQIVPQWVAKCRKRVIPLENQLRGLRIETEAAQWEGSIRGAWPVREYKRLMDLESEILSALIQLASSLGHLEHAWRVSLIRETLVLNPDFITEVMSVFTVVSQSLRTGEPLHQILPNSLLDRLLYHHVRTAALYRPMTEGRRPSHKKSRSDGYRIDGLRGGPPDNRSRSQVQLQLRPKPKASMLSILSDTYTEVGEDGDIQEVVIGRAVSYEDRIQDVNFMYFASAVSAVRQIASCLDELHDIAKELCGEVPFDGFREWRGQYEQTMGRAQ